MHNLGIIPAPTIAYKLLLAVAVFTMKASILAGCGRAVTELSRRSSAFTDDNIKPGRPTKPGGDSPANPPGGNVPPVEPVSPAAENDAFATSVYPLVQARCSNCHATSIAPLLAQGDIQAARLAVMDSGKVNFTDIANSRLYLRLARDNHHCWSDCASNAAEMKSALENWLALRLKINPNLLGELTGQYITGEMVLGRAEERQVAPDTKTVSIEAEAATLSATMVMMNDTEMERSYIVTPVGTEPSRVNNPMQQNVGGAVFNVSVPTAGSYQLWALINTPTDANDEIFIRIDNDNFERWKAPVTMANWAWVAANKNDGRDALKLELTAGNHTIELRRREVGFKIDKIALTSNPEFDGSQLDTRPVQVLRYDISAIAKRPNTFFEVQVAKFNDDSIKVRHPTIVSESPLWVKDIRILLNGKYNPQHNTFNLIEMVVLPPLTRLSNATMVVLEDIDIENDKISFSFGAIE